MGMYAEPWELAPTSFRERMESAKDAALHRDASKARARVKERRGPLIEYWSVSFVAGELGVTETRVKALCASGRFGKCRRSRSGKGRPYLIPAHWQRDGSYRLKLEPGKRGPKFRAGVDVPVDLELSPSGEIPF